MKSILILLSLTMLNGCQGGRSDQQPPVPVSALSMEYQESSAGVRRKYDGKEISVKGYAQSAATMPRIGDDQGSVLLQPDSNDSIPRVTCWFSGSQATEFSKIKGGQYLTVKGVFNGEAGADLKFCRIVKVE